MTRKRESYVQTAFDALAELGVKRGSHVILDDIVKRVGWAVDQPDERARLSGGLSALVYHGIVSRTQSRIGHQRVYRVDREPTPKLRPRHQGRSSGSRITAPPGPSVGRPISRLSPRPPTSTGCAGACAGSTRRRKRCSEPSGTS